MKMKMYSTIDMIFAISLLFCVCATTAYGQEPAQASNGLYNYVDYTHQLLELNKGDKEFAKLNLDRPIKYYSEEYDYIFINTHGVLTFNLEFTEFINQPFPLEYPTIAPFYSNIDTTGNNDSTKITIFESRNPDQLLQASSMVRYAFYDHADFEADRIIVATWQNVGYFEAKTDQLNTFQAVIIANDDETFVQFIYPENGLIWLQAENGGLGLPDIRPQVGFIAEDGRMFTLEGSATENAKYLAKTSNVGSPGIWIYQVGPLAETDNVRPPNNPSIIQETPKELWTCREASHGYCNSHAQCIDKSAGYCCICEDNYYGNGRYCIKKDEPFRVTGTVTGEINGEIIDRSVRSQSYVEMVDAHTYTAINPINMALGTNLRLALPLVSTLGWLFAKPVRGALNGFQLTGGVFTHESTLHFETGEVLNINQTFKGLNYWDQLDFEIEVFGKVPRITYGSNLHMADYIDEYKFEGPGALRSVHAHSLEVVEEKRVINFQLDQIIRFERCTLDDEADLSGTAVLQKSSKIALDYFERDQAVRSSMINKIGVDTETNSCNDGTATCGPNTVCVPYEDTYRCDCLHGYSPELNSAEEENCVDIDECLIGSHVCDENAECTNTEGGFSCTCKEGFVGNGYRCEVNGTIESNDIAENIVSPDIDLRNSNSESNNNQQDTNCHHCAQEADCISGVCVCRFGYSGNGYECSPVCPYGHIWSIDRCLPPSYMEVPAHCDETNYCICLEGFTLSDNGNCVYVGKISSDNRATVSGSCDVACHPEATCEWSEYEHSYMCMCNSGFEGDGFRCDPIEDSCFQNPNKCDPNALCQYDEELQRPTCICKPGYNGDGQQCREISECTSDYECGYNAKCVQNTCVCNPYYELIGPKYCAPKLNTQLCGSTYCGVNALCKWDAEQQVQYCDCIEGYEGSPLEGCHSKPLPCNIENNCGRNANCMPTEPGSAVFECRCAPGFEGDGYLCTESENCLNNPRLCDVNAQCRSSNNVLACVCNEGFYGNGSVCFERQRQESGFLLVSQGSMILRVPLNGRDVTPITVGSLIIDLDKDCVSGRVYWSDESVKKIESCKYDGNDKSVFISEDIESPEGIAIDASSRRIYWTDSVKDTIEVASLDDPSLRTVVINKNLVNPRGLAVDALREKLYWSDWNRDSPKIEMSNLDGTEREMLLGSGSVKLPNFLVVLESSGELCFADAGEKVIQCIEPYTKNLRLIANTSQTLSYPFGLTFAQDDFYYTDWSTKKLEKVDNYNGNRESMQIRLFRSQKMFGLTAIEDNCPQLSSPCSRNNGGCTDNRICLPNRNAPSGRSCKCTAKSLNCNIPRSGVPFY